MPPRLWMVLRVGWATLLFVVALSGLALLLDLARVLRGVVGAMSELTLWMVYERPTDYPHSWVVRRHYASAEGVRADPVPSAVAPSLEAARLAIPPGLHRIERDPDDEPQIAEVWL